MPRFVTRNVLAGPAVHEHPLLDRLYRARGVRSVEELDYALSGLHSPFQMKGMQAAADLLANAIQHDEKILIISDYDCDGATGCAIAVEGLRLLGGGYVDFLVPNRFEYGYGLSPAIVEKAAADFAPDLIVTVDNGIASLAGAQAVRDLPKKTKLLITDHHLAPETLPVADCIINPNQPGCEFPSKALAGCGVMFYALLATRAVLRDRGFFEGREYPDLRVLLDLVALGTVADVVPLDHNNRTLVHAGLRRINVGQVRPGIRALLELGSRQIGRIVAADFGFIAGPRLNAAGRLDDMTIGIRCLLEPRASIALQYATQLDQFNRERKQIENEMKAQALAELDVSDIGDRFGLCFYDDAWHQGVVGIVASRIKDKTYRPVICFAPDEDPTLIKGSARSVPGLHLRDVLADLDAKHPSLITKFGGHAMAAGLTIPKRAYARFAELFDAEVHKHLTAEDVAGTLETDGELSGEDFTLGTAEALKVAGPWGQKFPEPVFLGDFDVLDTRVVGERHLKLALRPHNSPGLTLNAIAFHCLEPGMLQPDYTKIRALYKLDVNEWRGDRSVQLLIDHIEPISSPQTEAA